jgi:hypothetical protein
MKVLKSRPFVDRELLTTFLIENNIPREDVFTISTPPNTVELCNYVLFFYGDPEVIEKKPKGFWG